MDPVPGSRLALTARRRRRIPRRRRQTARASSPPRGCPGIPGGPIDAVSLGFQTSGSMRPGCPALKSGSTPPARRFAIWLECMSRHRCRCCSALATKSFEGIPRVDRNCKNPRMGRRTLPFLANIVGWKSTIRTMWSGPMQVCRPMGCEMFGSWIEALEADAKTIRAPDKRRRRPAGECRPPHAANEWAPLIERWRDGRRWWHSWLLRPPTRVLGPTASSVTTNFTRSLFQPR